MLAMELIPTIRARLGQLEAERANGPGPGRDALASGHRAALWRAQQHAARIDNTLEDLRRYCLESLHSWHFLDEQDENGGTHSQLRARESAPPFSWHILRSPALLSD